MPLPAAAPADVVEGGCWSQPATLVVEQARQAVARMRQNASPWSLISAWCSSDLGLYLALQQQLAEPAGSFSKARMREASLRASRVVK